MRTRTLKHKKTQKVLDPESGFTLIEVMITLLISGILMAGLALAYQSQQKSYKAQSQVTEMQQNIRAAMFYMTRDIKMAGFDPTKSGNAGIITATAGRLRFTQDIDDNAGTGESDGDVNDNGENIAFGFTVAADGNDDGIPDAGGVTSMGMDIGAGHQAIADNIERVQFFYTFDDGTAPTTTPAAAQLDNIVTVTISILARASQPDPKYVNILTYTLGDGTNLGPFNDNFRRRLLVTRVTCRNMVM